MVYFEGTEMVESEVPHIISALGGVSQRKSSALNCTACPRRTVLHMSVTLQIQLDREAEA